MSTPLLRLMVMSLLTICLSGCVSFTAQKARLPDQVERDHDGQTYVVIISKGSRKSRHQMLWQEGLVLQDAVKRTGALRRFGNVAVEIKRPMNDGIRTIPLPAKFDSRKKSVTPETNYAIHPGDFVLITDVSKSPIDQLIDSFSRIVK